MAVWDKELEECRKAVAEMKKFPSVGDYPWSETPLEQAGVSLARAFDAFDQKYLMATEREELEAQWDNMQH